MTLYPRHHLYCYALPPLASTALPVSVHLYSLLYTTPVMPLSSNGSLAVSCLMTS